MATLLDLVQYALLKARLDKVSSITDTEEADEAADLVIREYSAIAVRHKPQSTKRLIQLQASGDSAHPNYLKFPDNVMTSEDAIITYDVRETGDTDPELRTIQYLDNGAFLDHVNQRDSDLTEVVFVQDIVTNVPLKIINDEAPRYYTMFDDKWLVFDSYDSAVDSTLQQSKSQAVITEYPSLVKADATVIDFSPRVLELLYKRVELSSRLHFIGEADAKLVSDVTADEEQVSSQDSRILKKRVWGPVYR